MAADKAASIPSVDEPATNQDQVPSVLMSETQRRLQDLIRNAPEEPRLVEYVGVGEQVDRLKIPDVICKPYPERCYKWESVADMTSCMSDPNYFYVPVTRSNHPKVPSILFDAGFGGIVFGGERGNILVFTHRANVERHYEYIHRMYAERDKEIESERKYTDPKTNREVGVIAPTRLQDGWQQSGTTMD